MVARGGIEPPTQRFSVFRSTTELPGHAFSARSILTKIPTADNIKSPNDELMSEAEKDLEATCALKEALTLSEKVKNEILYFEGTGNFFKVFRKITSFPVHQFQVIRARPP